MQMKNSVLILFLLLTSLLSYSQRPNIANREDLIKYVASSKKNYKEKILPNARFGVRWPYIMISSYVCTDQYSWSVFESYNVDCSLNSRFDKDMRKRVLQLLRNEYAEGELEKAMQRELDKWGFNKVTYGQSRINWYKLPKSLHKIYKDTSSVEFKAFADSCWQVKMESMRKKYTENYMFNLDALLNVCYYLKDKKIEKQLIKMLNDTTLKQYHKEIQAALICRHIEPYYTQCFMRNMYNDTTYDSKMRCNIDTLSHYIHSQESFRELSKFLLTNTIVHWVDADDMDDNGSIVSTKTISQESDEMVYNENNDYIFFDAFLEIKWKIRNQDLWDSLGYHPNNKDEEYRNDLMFFAFQNRRKIYEWMQANYGKYQIAPQW